MNFENYLEVIKEEKIANKIINLDVFKKHEKNSIRANGNDSFCKKVWDKTYSEIQKTWAEIKQLSKNTEISNSEKELKSQKLNKKLRELEKIKNQEYKKGKPYLISIDNIVGETKDSWLIENLVDENQTSIYFSKKWAPFLKEKGIINYAQIEELKNVNQKEEFIIFLHPEKSVPIYQNGKYIGNSFLSKMIWFFEAISGIWHKFKNYWSKEAIQKRKLEKERILSAKKRFKDAIKANKIALENSRKENIKKIIKNNDIENDHNLKKQAYFDNFEEECEISHSDMYEENRCKKIHIFK